ncbi:MAG: biosynthetic-type acetolactate synthase large subunit [Eubacterium sp.]|nr:biosynthetic-type acetolactate synthase large subunit [Eubacterium sp.]
MSKLTGADIICECLIEQGVDTVFGYPGGAVLNIYDSLYKYSDKITHILTAHEQGASHAADGYARASGRTGVVIATSGPGATNLVTGIATAYMDSVPMVAITGNVACALLGLDSFQEVDITGITMPITKHNFIVKDVNKLADTIREAFYIANEGRKGPVLIDVPKDITAHVAEFANKPIKPVTVKTGLHQDDCIQKAAEMIKESARPYIYCGGGINSEHGAAALKVFAKLVDAPVSSSLMAQGCFDQTDEHYIGMLGMHGTATAAKALSECDLFIAVGTRFSDRVIGDPNTFAKKAKVLHIDVDPAEINKNIPAYHKVIGDSADVLEKLSHLLTQQSHTDWINEICRSGKELNVKQQGTAELDLTPQQLIETLDRLTDGEAVICTEVGQAQMWAAQYYKYKHPRQLVTSGGLGTMGFGLGASIGSKCALPKRTVINIAGDGSFHMNLNELVTLSKHNIRVIELVVNNSVLGMVRQWQRLFYDKHFSQTTLDRPTDYVKLGEAFGIKSFSLTKAADCEEVLKQALEISETAPVLIEARIDRDINVLPMVPAGKPISEPILDIEIDD